MRSAEIVDVTQTPHVGRQDAAGEALTAAVIFAPAVVHPWRPQLHGSWFVSRGVRKHLCNVAQVCQNRDQNQNVGGLSVRNTFFIFVLVALILVPAGLHKALADCGEDCDSAYQSATKGCQEIYGDNPEDAGDLAICVLNARDDYRSCVLNCAYQAD